MGDMHPTEQEKQRLLALSDGAPWERVDAILDELHDRGAEWDDARTALSALVEDERAEVERLRGELEQIRTTETDVTWLADRIQAAIRDVSVRTARDPEHARGIIAQDVAEYISAGALTMFISSRVVDLAVDYIRQADAARLDGIEGRVAEAFAAADERGVVLDAMTVAELTDLVMGAVHGSEEADRG